MDCLGYSLRPAPARRRGGLDRPLVTRAKCAEDPDQPSRLEYQEEQASFWLPVLRGYDTMGQGWRPP